jgi:hypothetical protein
MKVLITIVLVAASLSIAMAQSSPPGKSASARKPATKKAAAAATRSECVEDVGLCVTVPAPWQRLGDIFDGLGFVVAEPHAGVDSAAWPQISVAAIDVPPQKANGAAPSLDSLIDIILTPDGSFTTSETQQRSRVLLNGTNAEILRVKLHDEASNTDTIEEVALIEGDDGLVYSIALRCAPQEFARLEPVFQKSAHSWHIRAEANESTPAPKARQDSDKK